MTNEYNEDNLIIRQIIDDHGIREVLTMKFDDKGRLMEQNSTYPYNIGDGYVRGYKPKCVNSQ